MLLVLEDVVRAVRQTKIQKLSGNGQPEAIRIGRDFAGRETGRDQQLPVGVVRLQEYIFQALPLQSPK